MDLRMEDMGKAPYSMQVDPELARQLVEKGATLLLLDMPPGTYFGIDHQGFTVGPKFKGVKMLPPGPHFITYRSISSQGGASLASGFFVFAKPRQIIVKEWDASTEAVVDMKDEDEAERYAAGVRRFDFDAHLAPYNMHAARTWSQLSGNISEQHVARLAPVGGTISIMAEAVEDPELENPKTDAERKLVQHLAAGRAAIAERMRQQQEQHAASQPNTNHSIPGSQQPGTSGSVDGVDTIAVQGEGEGMDVDHEPAAAAAASSQQGGSTASAQAAPAAVEGTGEAAGGRQRHKAGVSGRCFYTQLPRLVKQAGATAAELTALNLDKSGLLQQVLDEHYGGRLQGLLGELQFAFIAFVYGQSLDSYAQWKALLALLLSCEEAALHRHQAEYVQVIQTIRVQLSATLGAPSAPSGAAGGEEGGLLGGASPFGESMVDELLPDSFLRRAFGAFFHMLQENGSEVGVDLFREARELKGLLRQRLGWEYDVTEMGGLGDVLSGEDEDRPVLVDDPTAFVSL